MGPRRSGGADRADEVDGELTHERFLGHLLDTTSVGQARVVDDDVDLAERVGTGAHRLRGANEGRDVAGVGDRLAAGGNELVDHLLGQASVAKDARARRFRVAGEAHVAHYDLRAALGEEQRVGATDAAS